MKFDNEEWQSRFEAHIDGRPIKLLVYPSGELRVKTIQKGMAIINGIREIGSNFFPAIISDGDPIDIEAGNADELERELLTCGFSEAGAREITRHARNPG